MVGLFRVRTIYGEKSLCKGSRAQKIHCSKGSRKRKVLPCDVIFEEGFVIFIRNLGKFRVPLATLNGS